MNYQDYINWANEYKEQVRIIDKKLEEHKGKKRFSTSQERRRFENSTRVLYEMRRDCIEIATILGNKAKTIKELQGND